MEKRSSTASNAPYRRATDNPQRPGAKVHAELVVPRACRPSPEERRAIIALDAYFRAERRGFVAGYELEDWLAAEQDFERAHQGDRFCGD